jgi:hypothetical protein
MRNETPWTWGEEQKGDYYKLREALASKPILGYPTISHEGWIVDCDASDYAIGAVLSQLQDGTEVVIANAIKTLSEVQRRYCVTKKELLALEWALERFKPYVYGRRFLIRTDHKSLLAWKKLGLKGGMEIERWIGRIAENDFEIKHRSGRKHGNADWMSRPPRETNKEMNEIEPAFTYPCRKRPCICKQLIDEDLVGGPYDGEPDIDAYPAAEAALQATCMMV